MKLFVSMDWNGQLNKVGELLVSNARGSSDAYHFVYNDQWVEEGFQIDPNLPLARNWPYHSQTMPSVFQDICPNRWGKLVQQRAKNGFLREIDYLFGVSDHMRMGALRISMADAPTVFLSEYNDVPKLVNVCALQDACMNVEKGLEGPLDIKQLMGPATSLGGAHPKAVVQDCSKLFLAKFASSNDTERRSAWEATMLDLASLAGIETAKHRLLAKDSDKPILLSERFDRTQNGNRIPFVSARTLCGVQDTQSYSYAELASVIASVSAEPSKDCADLWRRMTFNALCGNIDDHLRNHAFLRTQEGWRLSPAYDLNPTSERYERRRHALAFSPNEHRPSLELCQEIAPYFLLTADKANGILESIGNALRQYRSVAKQNGLLESEITRMSASFEHADSAPFFTNPIDKISARYKQKIKPK